MFDHCTGPDEVWNAFYLVACLCHPSQGGTKEDFLALCAMARDIITDDEWPQDWPEIPNLFDIFCKATKRPNPFTLLEPKEPKEPEEPAAADDAAGGGGPVPFESLECQFAPAVCVPPVFGRVIRVFTAGGR